MRARVSVKLQTGPEMEASVNLMKSSLGEGFQWGDDVIARHVCHIYFPNSVNIGLFDRLLDIQTSCTCVSF